MPAEVSSRQSERLEKLAVQLEDLLAAKPNAPPWIRKQGEGLLSKVRGGKVRAVNIVAILALIEAIVAFLKAWKG